jgi:tRNA threonylcarbamoyladenosine biosynthesis protein TsaB
MNLLALDTSTETMSIALSVGLGDQAQVWHHDAPGAAQTSTQLIPAIQALLDQAGLGPHQLDAIAFGCGPGSFTGLRTACSVAQGLAFGASARRQSALPVLAVDTLLTVAEHARFEYAPHASSLQVHSLLDARMNEVYAGRYHYAQGHWSQVHDFDILKPRQVQAMTGWQLAGNIWQVYAEQLGPQDSANPWHAWPSARAMLRLAPVLLARGCATDAAHALPRYLRDKVAQTTQERAQQSARAATVPQRA